MYLGMDRFHFFLNDRFIMKTTTKKRKTKRSFIKNGRLLFLKKRSFTKTIVIRFLKVQNEWVVFKNDRFFPKTKRSFLKTIEKRIKKRSLNDRFQ